MLVVGFGCVGSVVVVIGMAAGGAGGSARCRMHCMAPSIAADLPFYSETVL